MSSLPPPPLPSQSALPLELPMGLVHIAKQELQVEDPFSETCRRDWFCITCWRAFCSHSCGSYHAHMGWVQDFTHVVRIDLDAGGRPIFPTRTTPGPGGHRIPASVAKIAAAEGRLLHCAMALRADVCSHHGNYRRLHDCVLRVEERDGQHCVRCTGDELWLPHIV